MSGLNSYFDFDVCITESLNMIKTPILSAILLLFSNTMSVADIGHNTDAQKIEIEIFWHQLQKDLQDWYLLNSEIYNPFSVPITLRDIRSEAGKVKLERSVSVRN